MRAGTAYIELSADLDRFKREVRAELAKKVTKEIEVKADTSSARREMAHVSREADRAHVSIGKVAGGLRTVYKEAALITAGGIGAQAISALGAAATATAASLAPLSGALAAYPALASAGGQALGTWKLAFNGVSQAVGGINEQLDKNSKAFRELTPEGKKFAEQLEAMKKPLRDLSETSQKGLLPGLTTGIKSAMTNFDVLQAGVGRTAKVLGGLATEAGKLVGSRGFGRDLETQMGRNDVTIRRLGEAGLHLGDALRHITIAAGPLVDKLTTTALSTSKLIDGWAKAGRKSGEFQRFFEETWRVMSRVARIAVDLGHGLFNIFKAAYPVGSDFLKLQVSLAEKFKDWTESVKGENAIKRFFRDAKPAMVEAEKLVGALVQSFGKLSSGQQVAPLLRTIRVELLPAITDMVSETTKAFGPHFLELLKQVVILFSHIGGTSGPLVASADVLSRMLRTVNTLIDRFPILGKVISGGLVVGGLSKSLGITPALADISRLSGMLGRLSGTRLGGLVSKATALPVFVVNMPGGGLPVGGGGVGNIVGGAGAGALAARARVLLRGAVKVAKPLALLDLGINLVDAKGNPITAAVNTAHDLSFGLIPRIDPNAAGKRNLSAFQQQINKLASEGNVKGLRDIRKELDSYSHFDAPGGIKQARKDVDRLIASTTKWNDLVAVNSQRMEGYEARIRRNSTTWHVYQNRLDDAREALRKHTKGSDQYNEAAQRVAAIQRRINERLLNTTHVTPEVKQAVQQIGLNFTRMGGNVQTAASYVAAAVNQVLSGLGADTIKFSLHQSARLKNYPHQRGAYIPGSGTGDTYPAMLEPGEYVLNREAVRAIGRDRLDHLNFGLAPRFQQGGGVDWGGHPALSGAIARAVGIIQKRWPGVGVSSTSDHSRLTTSGNVSNHVLGLAADLVAPNMEQVAAWIGQTMGPSLLEGIHNPNLSIKNGAKVPASFWGPAVWAQHINHIHIALRALGHLAAGATARAIKALGITGPRDNALYPILRGAERTMRSAGNKYIAENAVSAGGDDLGTSTLSGNAAANRALGRRMAAARGWTGANWSALDKLWQGESGWDATARNPSSGAAGIPQDITGNFHGGAAGQIRWGLNYIKGRYGTPSAAYRAWLSRHPHWYQRGGLVGMQLGGLAPSWARGQAATPKLPGSILAAINRIRHAAARGKLKEGWDRGLRRLINALTHGHFGIDDPKLKTLQTAVSRDEDYAGRAGSLLDDAGSEALSKALDRATREHGAIQRDPDTGELTRVLAPGQQDEIIRSHLPAYEGKNQYDWTMQKLLDQLAVRNRLIALYDRIQHHVNRIRTLKEAAEQRVRVLRARINQHYARLRTFVLAKVVKKIPHGKDAYRAFVLNKSNLSKDGDKFLQGVVWPDLAEYAELVGSDRAARLMPANVASKWVKDGDIGAIGRFGAEITEVSALGGDDGVGGALQEIQGFVPDSVKYTKYAQPPNFGTLGGAILDTQTTLRDFFPNLRVEGQSVETADTVAALGELLGELTAAARLQTSVRNIQLSQLSAVPFGGSFAEGGTVPGPPGAPRMILAHGGEVVTPPEQGVPQVSVNFNGSAATFERWLDAKIESHTRAQSARASRARAGRAGAI